MDTAAEGYSQGRENLILATLFLATFIVGLGMLMPTGLINELSAAFRVSIPRTASLVAISALLMCIGAPLLAFLTNRLQRHSLFAICAFVFGIVHIAAMYVTDFNHLLALRIIATIPVAILTPQATSSISLFMRPERRMSGIAIVFAGSTAAFAIGFPMVTLVAGFMGWAAAYGAVGASTCLVAVMLWIVMPRGLVPPPLSVEAWKNVFTTRAVMFVLGVTILSYIGQFTLWPYVAVDLRRNFAIGPAELALLLAIFGTFGVLGTITLTRIIGRTGPQVSATVFAALVAVSIFIWFAGHASFVALVVALLLWGYSYPPVVASQQARLMGNAPELASASIALNASVLYVGQAIGTSLGGAILTHYPITMLALAGAIMASAAFVLSWYCHWRWRI